MEFKNIPRSIIMITSVSIALAVIIGLNYAPGLLGGDGWRWPYEPTTLPRVMPLLLATAIYVFGAVQILRHTRRRSPYSIMIWSILAAWFLAMFVAHARDGDAFYAMFTRTLSHGATGPHWAAAHVDWSNGEWRDWTTVMNEMQGHIGAAPPGLPIWYGLLNAGIGKFPTLAESLKDSLVQYQPYNEDLQAYSSAQWTSAWFGLLLPFLSGLTVIPLYAAAKRVKGVDARTVVVWWPLVPGVTGFAASWSTVYPLLSVIFFWLLLRGLEDKRHGHEIPWIVGAGMLFGCGLFLSFSLLPLLGLFGFYTIERYIFMERHQSNPPEWLRPFSVAVWFWLGIVPPWVAFHLAGGQTIFALYDTAMSNHIALDRPYWFWLGMNAWDWALWTGIPIIGLWMLGIWKGVQLWRREGNWRHDELQPPLKGVALLLTLFVLMITGATRGEAGRLWLFLSPFVVIAAAYGLRHLTGDGRARGLPWLLITISQAIIMIALTANLTVMRTEFIPPETATAIRSFLTLIF